MDRNFFNENAEIVAKELLGKVIIMSSGRKDRKVRIVETEAYYDDKDPASRACQNGDLRDTMKMNAGTILVYGVHNNWLINFVTGSEGDAQAVLIRAVEPLNFQGKCSGPGLLTKALGIDKSFHKISVFDSDSRIRIVDIENLNKESLKVNKKKELGTYKIGKKDIISSKRIGIREDLDKPLRFYIKGNKHVSGGKMKNE